MGSLLEKMRPNQFSRLWQSLDSPELRVITGMLRYPPLEDGLVLRGPSGIGKAIIARLIGMRCCCDNTKLHAFEPCGRCEQCRFIAHGGDGDGDGGGTGYLHLDSRSINTEAVHEAAQKQFLWQRLVSNEYGDRLIVCLDKLDGLRDNRNLRKLVEGNDRAFFLMCTTDLKRIDEFLGLRCIGVSLGPIPLERAAEKLMMVASKEGWRLATAAATLLAKAGSGVPRDCLRLLERASIRARKGKIDEAIVRDVIEIVAASHRVPIATLRKPNRYTT